MRHLCADNKQLLPVKVEGSPQETSVLCPASRHWWCRFSIHRRFMSCVCRLNVADYLQTNPLPPAQIHSDAGLRGALFANVSKDMFQIWLLVVFLLFSHQPESFQIVHQKKTVKVVCLRRWRLRCAWTLDHTTTVEHKVLFARRSEREKLGFEKAARRLSPRSAPKS